ncbi:hypothetical protein niasHT_016942 [Heterodera trifolii]|uniref:Uncharacterized protein n=1 Tax=Heterodera trifolii TaxID=157864 RepID=A0ABD2LBU8_9BILA
MLNAILIRLIVKHTPKPMRIYSKYNFVTEKGEVEAIVYGLVIIKGVENRAWNTLAFICWVFLVYVSMFGYVSQFIFRYFVVVRGKIISTPKYFLLFFLMLLFPLPYCVNLFICYLPPAEHAIMEDKSVAEILGINLDDQIVLAGYSFKASMPLIIYFSVVFLLLLLLFKIDTKGWSWLQYYNLLSTIPMFLPVVLNPIVPICTINYYRHVLVSDVKRFVFFPLMFCRFALPLSFTSSLLILLLSSNLVLLVGAVFKLLDGNATLVSNPLENVVYLFQFPRTSTTPSQAPYNLMVETWLHWKRIPFHRISNKVSLGSHSKGTAPFAYFNGQYIDGSKEIIKTVGQHFQKYQPIEGEEELMGTILDMFNILMVDREAGLEWMTEDEALVEVLVPLSFADRPLTVQLGDDGNFNVSVNQQFWEQYFDAFNAKGQTEKVAFVKAFLKPLNGTDQKEKNGSTLTDGKLWVDFSAWLRQNVIKRTLETVLTVKVNGQPNTANPGNSQAKLKQFLALNSLVSAEGTTKKISEFNAEEIAFELKRRWEQMEKLVEQNRNKSLNKKKQQTMPDAALFGILIQFFETPLNLEKFKEFSAKEGPLFEFTKRVKHSLSLGGQKWDALRERPWQLNFDTERIFNFTADSSYNGPYKLEVGDGLQDISKCISSDNSSLLTISAACSDQIVPEILMSAKALLNIVNKKHKKSSTEMKKQQAQALFSVLSSFLCTVGTEGTEKSDCKTMYLDNARQMYKKMGVTDEQKIKSEILRARRTVFNTIIAYNDAKTGEAVHAAIVAVRAVISGGGDAANAAVSSTELTNEY